MIETLQISSKEKQLRLIEKGKKKGKKCVEKNQKRIILT